MPSDAPRDQHAADRAVVDRQFMKRALALARATVALASPNPQVGCVLVREPTVPGKDPAILGEGAHRYADFDHAEVVALKQAAAQGHDVHGATAYVTLEPCSHHGRTAPCANALIAAGIARVVVATVDPNPLIRGHGIANLRAAGIAVTEGVCEAEARALNDAFAFAIQHRRPFVTLKSALSADSKLAPPPASRVPNQPFWLTGPAARAEVQQLRHASDAILTGVGTVLMDDPALTDRTSRPRRRPLLRVVLDTHLRTPLDSQLVRLCDHDLLLLCSAAAPASRIAALESRGVDVAILHGHAGRLSLPAALNLLWERRHTSVLLEAGSALNGAFLAQHLIDRLILYTSDTELGPAALPFADGIPNPQALEQNLIRPERAQLGPDHCISGLLHDPWSSVPSAHPGKSPAPALAPMR